MGRGKKLKSDQTTVVKALQRQGLPACAIAAEINKSVTSVQNCISRMRSDRRPNKAGRPSTITPQFHGAILRSVALAPDERVTASTLISKYKPRVGVKRVQQLMQESDQLRWNRIKRASLLSDDHKSDRLNWAKAQLYRSPAIWLRTILSDEKRFSLDGPDGSSHNRSDKRLDPRYFFKIQNGGGGVMVRVLFCGWCTESCDY